MSFSIALLASSIAIATAAADVQLLPFGEFVGRDGRPGDGLTWKLNNDQGRDLAARLNARHASGVEFNYDYEHQAVLSEKNGQPAPASGWNRRFEWRDGVGLFALQVAWTDKARQMIEAKEYLYISPVIVYDKKTGVIRDVFNAALTNNPCLEMDSVAQERLGTVLASFLNLQLPPEPTPMNELLKALLKALGLTETVTVQDATAAVTALLSKASTVDTLTAEKAALKAKADQADNLTTELAALKAAKPGEVDPTKYVTLDKFNELNQQLAALSAKQTGDEVEALLKQAQDEGKVHGVAVDVWRDVGKSDIAKLRSLVEKTPANPVLAGQRQTDATKVPTDVAALSAGQKEICQRMGLKEEDFLATLKANAA